MTGPTARQAATAAARAAGVEVCRVTTPQEAAEVRDLFTAVWGRAEEPVVTAELLRVVAFVGGYVHAAYAGGEDGPMVGAALALPTLEGRSPRGGLHSHAAAVLPGHRAGVGFALKVDQRAWALDRGLREITWTFDPLIRRNAHFNLTKLAAEPAAYLVDFYGEMHDDINAGQGSDRLLLRWDLDAARVADACTGVPWSPPVPHDARTALAVDADGGPTAMAWNGTAGALLVHVPPDVEAMRRRAPRQAVAWRHAVREVLAGLMTEGWAVTGFVERRAYLLRRPERG